MSDFSVIGWEEINFVDNTQQIIFRHADMLICASIFHPTLLAPGAL